MIFQVLEAVFIESAYISRDSKMSVSTRDATGGALGAATVEAIVGMPGGLFVRHRKAWNLVPWANVKSARLADAPAEVLDFVGRTSIAGAADRLVNAARTAREEFERPQPFAEGAIAPAPVFGPTTINPLVPSSATTAASAPEIADMLGLPARDAGGVLISAQPQSGPTIVCHTCQAPFIQGANHVCQKAAAEET